MKNTFIYILAILAGSAIGYLIGLKGDLAIQGLLIEILFGASVSYGLVLGFLHIGDGYAMLTGSLTGLFISLILDWVAGSPPDFKDELGYMLLCSFVGWGYRWGWLYWYRVLIGGFVVGVLGFVWGLNNSQLYGRVYLMPGLLNAALTFVRFLLIGAACSSFYLKSFGWRLLAHRR